jgi:hypothetical protein
MSRRLQSIARFTLAVMLVTFLSPTTGWAMLAGHDELAHAAAAFADHDATHADHHDHGMPADHDHADPHSFIGHLFSHMPFSIASAPFLPPGDGVACHLTATAETIVSANVKPPFRPPLGIAFAI